MFKMRGSNVLLITAFLALALVLAGCGGGGSGLSVGGLGGGGGGKAALNGNNIITITNANGATVGTGSVVNGEIALTFTGALTSSSYPLLLTLQGGTLLRQSGNQAFSGTLRSYVLESSTVVNITAFTTLHSYLYERTPATLSVSERYSLATTWMNDFFAKLGAVTTTSVNFLTDNPYTSTKANAYETYQQILAYICGESDGLGLANISSRLKTFANEYVDAVNGGTDPAAAIAVQAGTFTGTAGLVNGDDLANLLNTATVLTQIAEATASALNAPSVAVPNPPTQAEVEASVSKPTGYDTQIAGITGVAITGVQAATAGNTTPVGPRLTQNDGTVTDGALTISWASSYTVPADFVSAPSEGNISNGGTYTTANGTNDLIIKWPTTPGKYSITFTCASNTNVKNTITIETLATDTQTITSVQLLNATSATATTGIAFTGGAGGQPTILGDGAAATGIAANKLSATLAVTAAGSPSAEDYIVNFLAPDGVRFVRGSANYPNYAVTATVSGSNVTANAGIASMVIDGTPSAGLKDFAVRVETFSGTEVAYDSLDNGMYIINGDHQDNIAEVSSFAWAGTQTGQGDVPYDLSVNAFTGNIKTWRSIAGLGSTTAASVDGTYYGTPILKLVPGTGVANYGLTVDGSTWGNQAVTSGFNLAQLPGARTLGTGAGASRAVKVPSAAGSTNQAKVWLVIPATSSNSGGDITSTGSVLFTR